VDWSEKEGTQLLLFGEDHRNALACDFLAAQAPRLYQAGVRRFLIEVPPFPCIAAVNGGSSVTVAQWRGQDSLQLYDMSARAHLYNALHDAGIRVVPMERVTDRAAEEWGDKRELGVADRFEAELRQPPLPGEKYVAGLYGANHLDLGFRPHPSTPDAKHFHRSVAQRLRDHGHDVTPVRIVGGFESPPDAVRKDAKQQGRQRSIFEATLDTEQYLHLPEYLAGERPEDLRMEQRFITPAELDALPRRQREENETEIVRKTVDRLLDDVFDQKPGACAVLGTYFGSLQAYALAAPFLAFAHAAGDELMTTAMRRTLDEAPRLMKEFLLGNVVGVNRRDSIERLP
jgi:hypothetical protein